MGKTVFLTGATGFLGMQILEDMMANTDHTVYVLIRAQNPEMAAIRICRLCWDIPGLKECIGNRIIPVPGDITHRGLGMEEGFYASLAAEVTHIIHSAAEVSIRETRENLWKVNVEGTRNLLEFAAEVAGHHALSRFSFISTAYVAGRRCGVIREEERIDQGFRSYYEESKFEAEKLVMEYRHRFPVSVFRPGQIIGHSRTGRIHSFNTMYYPLKLYLNGKLRFLPVSSTLKMNIVPVDYVSDAVIQGTFKAEAEGRIFHLTAPADTLPTVSQLLSFVRQWAADELSVKLPKPLFIPVPGLSNLGIRYNLNPQNSKAKAKTRAKVKTILSSLLALSPYFTENRSFQTENTRNILAEYKQDWKQYIGPILRYAAYMGFLDRTDRSVYEQILQRLESRRHPVSYSNITQEGMSNVLASEIAEDIHYAASALKALGVEKGDRIAVVGLNSTRYFIADVAIGLAGAISVPLYFTSPLEEMEELIGKSGSRILFIGDPKIVDQSSVFKKDVLKISFCNDGDLDRAGMPNGVMPWNEFLQLGKGQKHRVYSDFGSPVTIRYTSGTTGKPKGVMFHHFGIKWMAESLASMLPWKLRNSEIRYISFLPMNHVVEGILANYSAYYNLCRVKIFFLENFQQLSRALPKVRPTVFFSVPRFYEKLWEGVTNNRLGSRYLKMERGLLKSLLGRLLKKILLKKAGLDQCRMMVVGSAPVSDELLQAFRELGIEIQNAYGLTEAPLITMNRLGRNRIGTVGEPLPATVVKLGHDGEILVKGPQVTMGFYGDDASGSFEDGFLKTGDIGSLSQDRFLTICGRKKEMMVTSYGKNIYPLKIESMLRDLKHISNALLIGDNRPYCIALLWLENGSGTGFDAKALDKSIESINSRLSNPEKVKKWVVLNAGLSIGDGELTANLKVKRDFVLEKYASLVESVYNGSIKASDAFHVSKV